MMPAVRRSQALAVSAVAALALAGSASDAPAQGADDHPLAGLAWLAGCWEAQRGGMAIEEQWMEPRGATMLGMSRTVVNGRVREYEHIAIHADSAGIVYVATPSRQVRTEFRAVTRGAAAIAFENLQHDFPQRISYRSAAQGDSLIARISGPRGGVERAIEFGYRRAECPGARPPAGNPGGY